MINVNKLISYILIAVIVSLLFAIIAMYTPRWLYITLAVTTIPLCLASLKKKKMRHWLIIENRCIDGKISTTVKLVHGYDYPQLEEHVQSLTHLFSLSCIEVDDVTAQIISKQIEGFNNGLEQIS